ncbi:hypothetical protein ACWERV_07520 [Streptomyces sp. NPDC004031]
MSEPLSPPLPIPWNGSSRMPSYRAVFAIDAKGFTELPAILHKPVSQLLLRLVDQALDEAGLSALKIAKSFLANTGDGLVFGFPPELLPPVIWPFLTVLDSVLNRHNAGSGRPAIRLRASLNVGPLPDRGDTGDGNGTARNDTHRLLDSRPVKDLLAAAHERATHLAVILSQRVYEDAVLGGYSGLRPERFMEVTATVPGKRFAQQAWLFVPSPSGGLLRDGSSLAGPDVPPTAPQSAPPSPGESRTIRQYVGNGIAHQGTVHGGIRFTADPNVRSLPRGVR